MTDTAIATTRTCLNCAEELTGRYCAHCGQQEQDLAIPVRRFIAEFFDTVFSWDSRLLLSARQLILRPGYLTLEYYAGRRVRYESPLRLYLLSSVLFLLLASIAAAPGFRVDLPGTVSARDGNAPVVIQSDNDASVGPFQSLRARWQRDAQRAVDNPDLVRRHYVRAFSWTMFLAMPAFAVLLGLWFRGGERMFVHHLVFALHYHAFTFLLFSVLIIGLWVLPAPVHTVTAVAMLASALVYLVIGLRIVFRQSFLRTALKTVALMLVYVFVIEALSALALIAVVLVV